MPALLLPLLAALLLAAPAAAEPALTRAPELHVEILPAYPEHLERDGVQGDVVVRLHLDEAGLVTDAELLAPLHPELDASALDAAFQLRFTAAEVDGEPAPITIDYTFTFRAQAPAAVAAITGRLADRRSGQPIPEATISVSGMEVVAESDSSGRFALADLPPGEHTVVIFHPDFERLIQTVNLVQNEELTVEGWLVPTAGPAETVVSARKPWREVTRAPLYPDESPIVGRWELTRRDIELTPGAMGEVTKVVAQLPGVVADTDMFATFHVRGGAQHETGFFLDGVQMLNPNHLGGTFTLFNPKLVRTVRLDTAATPAAQGDFLSGALAVDYIDGDNAEVDGLLDVNMAMASLHVSGPLGPKGAPATFLVSARRSYFEAYFALLKAVGLFDEQFVGMAFGEYLARITAGTESTPHRLRFTVMHSHDRLQIDAGDPESSDAVIALSQGIDTSNRVSLVSADWRWRVAEPVDVSLLAYFTHDTEQRLQEASFDVSRAVNTWRSGLRATIDARLFEGNNLSAGVDAQWFSTSGDGAIKDPRVVPTWAATPWTRLAEREFHFESSRDWTELAFFIQDDWARIGGLPLSLTAGLRAQVLGPTDEVLVSPRGGLSVPLPTGTTIKASLGLFHQPLRDPVVLDPVVGAKEPQAERVVSIAAGVEQWLPFGGLIRVEGYHKILDRLLVHPDTVAALDRGGTWESIGTGTASGLDAFFGARGESWTVAATYSLGFSRRTNPLNEAGEQTIRPAWDQRHGIRLAGLVRFGKNRRWAVSGTWDLRSGRPLTPVSRRRDASGSWTSTPYAYNSRDLGWWTEFSLRVEHHFPLKNSAKMTIYLDVLNATHAQGQFIWIYGDGAPGEDGELDAPRAGIFRQLPIRPWIGGRIEF